jgi:hypothetical protein
VVQVPLLADFLSFLIESKICIKHETVENVGKMLNMLFDTFRSTKYFPAHLYTLACHFCVD